MSFAEAITDARSLLEALDHRPRDEVGAKAFDAAIWAAKGANGALLVTDLSGFTRVTKDRGIIQFLSVFRRCQVACLPLITAHGGTLLKEEADDFIVFFDEPAAALHCGIAMLRVLDSLNVGAREDEQISMCIGLEYGPLLRLSDDAYGDTVNVAFKLGEDLATANEILVGRRAHDRLHQQGFDFDTLDVSALRSSEAGNVLLEHFSVRLSPHR